MKVIELKDKVRLNASAPASAKAPEEAVRAAPSAETIEQLNRHQFARFTERGIRLPRTKVRCRRRRSGRGAARRQERPCSGRVEVVPPITC